MLMLAVRKLFELPRLPSLAAGALFWTLLWKKSYFKKIYSRGGKTRLWITLSKNLGGFLQIVVYEFSSALCLLSVINLILFLHNFSPFTSHFYSFNASFTFSSPPFCPFFYSPFSLPTYPSSLWIFFFSSLILHP
jgi:hypothetical protein